MLEGKIAFGGIFLFSFNFEELNIFYLEMFIFGAWPKHDIILRQATPYPGLFFRWAQSPPQS